MASVRAAHSWNDSPQGAMWGRGNDLTSHLQPQPGAADRKAL